ncbi:hypothetical protein ACP275_02G059600 [Erythranthe tilingii]
MGSSSSSSTIAPLLLRNLLTAIFIHANKSLISFSHKYKFFELLRCFLVSVFLFFLGLLPSFFSCLSPSHHNEYSSSCPNFKSTRDGGCYGGGVGGGGSGVSRALSQLLSIMNDIPVSSRKYEVVRSLAEKLIDENLLENNRALREVNCAVLSVAFARSLSQLEAALAEQGRRSSGDGAGDSAAGEGDLYDCSGKGSRLMKGVKYYGVAAWRYAKSGSSEMRRCSGEKLAAELLWLAQKMAASGCAEEAVCKWALASNLAWLALSAEPRLQGSLVKVSAFLIKQAKQMGKQEEEEEEKEDQETNTALEEQHIRQTKMKMLMSWLPLLCRANNGTDAPILSMGERAEMERILEAIISTLREEDEQECVLSLWLHHFTYCSASDWPNLRSCYTRWYSATCARVVLASV